MPIGDPDFMRRAQETFQEGYGKKKTLGRPRKALPRTGGPSQTPFGRPREYTSERVNLMIRVTSELHERIRKHAAMEHRSMSNLVARILYDALPDVQVRTE